MIRTASDLSHRIPIASRICYHSPNQPTKPHQQQQLADFSSSKKLSPSMSPSFTHLKALRVKINSKINKVKSSMHKTKAAVDETELNAQPKRVKREAKDTTTSDSEPNGEELQEIMVAPKPKNNGEDIMVAPKPNNNGKETVVASEPNIDGEEITAASKPIINGEDGAQEIIVTSEPIINGEEQDAQSTMVTPKPTINGEEIMVAPEPNTNGEEGHELVELNRDATKKDEKAAKRQAKREARKARRQARKAKWSARGATFKKKSKKVGEAVFWPVAVAVGVICCPVMLAVDACLCIYKGVVWLVVKIFDTLCCGPVLVGLVCCAHKE